jgi:hypothetical protein
MRNEVGRRVFETAARDACDWQANVALPAYCPLKIRVIERLF